MESLKSSKNKPKKEAIDRLGFAGGEEGEEEEASLLTKRSMCEFFFLSLRLSFSFVFTPPENGKIENA